MKEVYHQLHVYGLQMEMYVNHENELRIFISKKEGFKLIKRIETTIKDTEIELSKDDVIIPSILKAINLLVKTL